MTLIRDFPQPVGNRYVGIIDHAGPTSYTQLSPGAAGSPPTGGDTLLAAEAGMKFITAVSGQLDSTGTYTSDASMGASGGAEQTKVFLIWCLSTTGAQVGGATNLSGFFMRFIVWGR